MPPIWVEHRATSEHRLSVWRQLTVVPTAVLSECQCAEARHGLAETASSQGQSVEEGVAASRSMAPTTARNEDHPPCSTMSAIYIPL